jgi:hypothetical protein
MVSVYSHPDPTLLSDSHGTLRVCTYLGSQDLRVINATAIEAVIGMIPFPLNHRETITQQYSNCFYVAEKLSLATPDELDDDEDEVNG